VGGNWHRSVRDVNRPFMFMAATTFMDESAGLLGLLGLLACFIDALLTSTSTLFPIPKAWYRPGTNIYTDHHHMYFFIR